MKTMFVIGADPAELVNLSDDFVDLKMPIQALNARQTELAGHRAADLA